MKALDTFKILAGGTVLSFALLAGTAQADMAANEEVAAEIQQAIELNPELGQYALDVNADDDKVVLSGMIGDQEHYDAVQQIVDDMADMGTVENNIVRN